MAITRTLERLRDIVRGPEGEDGQWGPIGAGGRRNLAYRAIAAGYGDKIAGSVQNLADAALLRRDIPDRIATVLNRPDEIFGSVLAIARARIMDERYAGFSVRHVVANG